MNCFESFQSKQILIPANSGVLFTMGSTRRPWRHQLEIRFLQRKPQFWSRRSMAWPRNPTWFISFRPWNQCPRIRQSRTQLWCPGAWTYPSGARQHRNCTNPWWSWPEAVWRSWYLSASVRRRCKDRLWYSGHSCSIDKMRSAILALSLGIASNVCYMNSALLAELWACCMDDTFDWQDTGLWQASLLRMFAQTSIQQLVIDE